MTSDPNTPQLASFDQQAMEQLRPYLLDPREDYPEPYFMLEFNGVPFSTLGGIQAISGQKKNGKSFVLTQLMAAILGYDTERVQTFLPGLTVPRRTIEHLGHEPRVLYCDTEMEKLNSAKVLRRVHWLCGWDMKLPSEQFFVLWLREVPKTDTKTSNTERWRLIKNAIEQVSPDIVFVDGLRDLVNDFNDNQESAAIVGEMMSLASQRNICIWNVLHMNPRPQNDDESKMRGHLGTELGNKVSDTFISSKKKDQGTGQVTFTVKQQDARGKDVDDWQFIITDDAGGLGIPKILGTALMSSEEIKRRQEIMEADAYFKSYIWAQFGATYTELEKWIRTKGVTSNRKIKSLFDTALETGIIIKDSKKKYHYKGIDKPLVNDAAENIPFAKPDPTDETPF